MNNFSINALFITWRLRAPFIIVLCLICYAFILKRVRAERPVYHAAIKIFVRHSGVSGPQSKFSFGRLQAFLARQRDFLRTRPILERVADALGDKGKKKVVVPQNIEEDLSITNLIRLKVGGVIRRALLGNPYVKNYTRFTRNPVNKYRGMLSFMSDIKSGTFTITAASGNPNTALTAVQAAADALIDLNKDVYSKGASSLIFQLERKVRESNKNLEASSKKISDFLRKHNLKQGLGGGSKLMIPYNEFYRSQNAYLEAKKELERQKTILKQTKRYLSKLRSNVRRELTGNSDAKIQALIQEIKTLEVGLIAQKKRGTNRTVVEKRVKKLKNRLAKELEKGGDLLSPETVQKMLVETKAKIDLQEAELRAAEVKFKSVQEIFQKKSKGLESIPKLEATFAQLNLYHSQTVKMHEALVRRYMKILSKEETLDSALFIIDEPSLRGGIATKRKMRILVKSAFLYTLAILLIFVLFEIKRGSLIGVNQLTNFDMAQFLGVFSHMPDMKKVSIATSINRNVGVSRMVHTLNRELKVKFSDRPFCLVFSSEMESSGKSLSSLAFSVGLSKIRSPVLVVDCDFRASIRNISKYYQSYVRKKTEIPTVKDMIARVKAKPDLLRHKEVFVTRITDGGSPNEIIQTMRQDLAKVVSEARGLFNAVILDTAPLRFLDTLLCLEVADAIVLCCPEGRITMQTIQEMASTVERHKSDKAVVYSVMTNSYMRKNHKGIYAYQNYQYQKHRKLG